MITLAILAEQHINFISGDDPADESRKDPREVMLHIRQILSELVSHRLYLDRKEGDRSTPAMYHVAYEIPIEKDGARKQKYIDLPEFYIHMPFNSGIPYVFYTNDPQEFFYPRHNPSVTTRLPIGTFSKRQSYTQIGLRLLFDRDDVDRELNHKKITVVLLIPAPESIGEDEPLPITAEMQSEILRRLKEMDQPILPSDNYSDYKDVNAQQKQT